MELKELKKEYNELKKKHKLPGFDEMNNAFSIGKLERHSGNLLRDLRVFMMDKVVHYIRLMELMLNPSQSSPVFMVLLKEVNQKDREIINRVLKNFVVLELRSFKMDVNSKENKESELVKDVFNSWKETSEDLLKVIGLMERNWKSVHNNKKEKGYFG